MKTSILAIPAAFALAGCMGSAASEPPPASSEPLPRPETNTCSAQAVQYHVGHDATQAMGEAILRESGAAMLRWGPPDSVWTMDYRPDRVNVRYDRDMKITAVTCG